MRFDPGLKLARHSNLGKYFEGEFVSPINVEISPSGKCQAACDFCFYRQEGKSLNGLDKVLFEEDRMKSLIDEFAEMGVKSISWTGGGEPSMHPSFGKFVDWTHKSGLKQGLFTNGLIVNYDSTKFDWIRVSKTNRDWKEENLKELNPKTLGMCLNYDNSDMEVMLALKIAEQSGVDYLQVRPALKILGKKTGMNAPKIKHSLLSITDYKFSDSSQERNYIKCEAFHFNPFIWQNGDVDVCGYKKNKGYNLGNVHNKGFKEIMEQTPKYFPVTDDCQTCCKLNSMNSTIKQMYDLEDIDFP